jgi:transposase-like protein
MKKTRRRYEAEEKVAILKRHLLGKESVSDICEDIGVSPHQFYRWQKEFFDNGAAAFQHNGRRENAKVRKMEHKVEFLEGKLRHKDNVIAEITEDYVHLKKSLGEA